jgi:hypothetical protein
LVRQTTNKKIALLAYITVAAVMLVGASGAVAVLIKRSTEQEQTSFKTAIESQLASAREIREALARPIARPEPLPPISSKVKAAEAKAGETRVAEVNAEPPPKKRHRVKARPWFQARQAFASFEPYRQQPFLFMSFGGRH